MAATKITVAEYNKRLRTIPEDQRDSFAGWSPGFVAARLGITRAAVHQAIRRDKLHAFRLHRGSQLVAIIIPEDSVREYETSETRAKFTPKEYRATG